MQSKNVPSHEGARTVSARTVCVGLGLVAGLAVFVTTGVYLLLDTLRWYVQPGSVGLLVKLRIESADRYYSLPLTWVLYGISFSLATFVLLLYAWRLRRRHRGPSEPEIDSAPRMQFRYSVRLMLVAVTVFALALGWCATRVQAVRKNARLVETLRSMGAIASLDDGSLPSNRFSDWLHVQPITRVGNASSDEALAHLKKLEHLRFVQVTGQATNAGIAHLRNLVSLHELHISSPEVTNAGLSALAGLQNLKALSLSGTSITGAGLRNLVKLSRLRTLDLDECAVDDAGLEHLESLHRLEELRLNKTRVTNAGLHHLADLKSLKRLDVGYTAVTSDGLAELLVDLQGRNFEEWFPVRRGFSLVSMSLNGQHHNDNLIPYALDAAPDLTDLYLNSTRMTDDGIASLTKLTQLRNLSLVNMPEISVVEDFPSLVQLVVSGLGAASFPRIRKMPNLEELSVTDRYAGKHFERIVDLVNEAPKLKVLNLEGTAIGDEELRAVVTLKQLRELNLGGTEITDVGLANLADADQLESLQLRGTHVTAQGLANLGTMKQLRYLGLTDIPAINDESVDIIASLTSLQEVSLYRTGMSATAKATLGDRLPNCQIHY